MNFTPILCLMMAIPLASCATVTKGTHEEVRINSEPEGASAVSDIRGADGKKIACAATPCVLNLPRKTRPRITVSKDGHQSIIFALASSRATSSSSVPTGAIIAGTPQGSHVIAGSPDLLKRVPVSVTAAGNAFLTLGAAVPIDAATGANLSLSPNPVTVILAPNEPAIAPDIKVEIIPEEALP